MISALGKLCGIKSESMDFRIRLTWLKSWFYYFLALWLWMVISPPIVIRNMTWDSISEVLSTVLIKGFSMWQLWILLLALFSVLHLGASSLPFPTIISYSPMFQSSPILTWQHHLSPGFLSMACLNASMPRGSSLIIGHSPSLSNFWAWYIWQLWAFGNYGEPSKAIYYLMSWASSLIWWPRGNLHCYLKLF